MFYELLQLAMGNLGRARARLIMTSAGVLVGTTAVILLIALTIGLQQAAEASIGSSASLTEIEVYPNYNPQSGSNVPQLDVALVQTLWQVPGVAAVIPIVNMQGGEMQSGDYTGYAYPIAGIDPRLLPYMGLQIARGAFSLQPGDVIVGARAGDNFYDPESRDDEWRPVQVDLYETPVRLRLYQNTGDGGSRERNITLRVVGQLQESNNQYDYGLLMPFQDVIQYNEWITGQEPDPENFRFDQVIVRATSRETANDVSRAIRDLGYATGGLGEYLQQLNGFFTTMRLMLGGVGGVALLVAAFGVANTMMMAILERTREIGLMKAIGASNQDVLTVFLIEAGLVGLVGGLAGVGLSYVLQNLINQAVQNASSGNSGGVPFLPLDPSQIGGSLVVIPAELALGAIVLAVLVGVGAGFYPALRAAQMPPVLALKQE